MSNLGNESDLNGLEASDKFQMSTVTQHATKPKPTCHHCKTPGHYRYQGRQWKTRKNEASKDVLGITTVAQKNLTRKKTTNNKNSKNNKTRQNTKLRVVYSLTETCGKTNHSKAFLKPVHQLYCLTRKGNLHDRKRYSNRAQLILQIRASELQLTLQLSNCT